LSVEKIEELPQGAFFMSKTTDFTKTIYALATALGTGSIAVIRLSGPDAITIASRIFKGKDLQKVKSNTIHFGKIEGDDRAYDQVLISVFRMPQSYTGENYVEISCHANLFIVDDIMRIISKQGALAARPGEFTLRSFLNGKRDLTQAEAVASIIEAKSRTGVKNSMAQLNGKLSKEIHSLKQNLIDIISLMEIDLDFSEEELDVVSAKEIIEKLIKVDAKISHLVESFNYARLLKDGINLVIVGETNAGKSTLLNQLLGENRVITSHIPGTTRDTIHESLLIRDVLFNLVDTAGLRKTGNKIESEGIKRTREQIDRSDLVLLLIDASKRLNESSMQLIRKTIDEIKGQTILIANKKDLGLNKISQTFLSSFAKPLVSISAKSGTGINDLKEVILHEVSVGIERYAEQMIITSERQFNILKRVRDHLFAARDLLEKKGGFEFAVVDLRQALDDLGEISGETATDDILNNIFANFCIGK
jgi:tRNA modification GTPase